MQPTTTTTHNNLEDIRTNILSLSRRGEVKQNVAVKAYAVEQKIISPAPNTITSEIEFPAPGTPHWRRIRQVFQALDTAPLNASYNQLIEYVRETTGKGCSRKLISKWKKYRQNSDLLPPRDDLSHGDGSETNTVGVSPAMTISAAIPSNACPRMGINSFQLNQSVDNSGINDSLSRPNLLPVKRGRI